MQGEPAVTNLDQDQIRWARRTPRAERFIAGATLFDYAVTIMTAGITRRQPNIKEEELLKLVRERLEWADQWG